MCLATKVNVPDAPAVAQETDPAFTSAKNAEKRRQAASQGQSSTVLSSGSSTSSAAPAAGKTLLGQ